MRAADMKTSILPSCPDCWREDGGLLAHLPCRLHRLLLVAERDGWRTAERFVAGIEFEIRERRHDFE